MRDFRGRLRAGVVTAALLMVSSAGIADTGHAPTVSDDAALRARYAVPGSRFVEIDGVPVHYVDEGSGPAIMLLHGSFASLRQWNGWAGELKKHYRVVRFDMPPLGLSGPAPDADYSLERRVGLIEALRSRLGIERFLLVATSSGAISGAAYAAGHPQQLTGFVYSNATVGKVILDRASFPEALKRVVAEDGAHKWYHTEEYWRQILLFNIEDKSKVTPDLVREWTQLNNRALKLPQPEGAPPAVTHERTLGDLAAITVPTLFLWGQQDHEATVTRDAERGMALLGTQDKQLIVVPRCGHMLPLDCDARALTKAMPFIRRVTRSGK